MPIITLRLPKPVRRRCFVGHAIELHANHGQHSLSHAIDIDFYIISAAFIALNSRRSSRGPPLYWPPPCFYTGRAFPAIANSHSKAIQLNSCLAFILIFLYWLHRTSQPSILDFLMLIAADGLPTFYSPFLLAASLYASALLSKASIVARYFHGPAIGFYFRLCLDIRVAAKRKPV